MKTLASVESASPILCVPRSNGILRHRHRPQEPTMPATLTYHHAPMPVRAEFAAAHSRFWDRLAEPGTWWTPAERIAIAREARHAPDCSLCDARAQSLSPNVPVGDHDSITSLAQPAIDAVHRLVNDASRLSAAWLDRTVALGLSLGHYVELIGTVVSLVSIDRFCRGIGVPLHPLPAAGVGAPSQYRPSAEFSDAAWVPMIPADGNDGAEADLWPSGRTANVIRALSLVPDEVRTLKDLSAAHYLPNDAVADPQARCPHLDRQQMELIAGRVSALNQCFY
jgi:hypothetical protein